MNELTNPLGDLIEKKAREQGLTRKAIVVRLGYKNHQKGYLRFDQCINDGQFTEDFLERLQRVLNFDQVELDDAIKRTIAILRRRAKELAEIDRREAEKLAAEIEARGRANFQPHLWVVPERSVPSSIFVVAWTGPDFSRRVDLPDGIETLSEQQQCDLIRSAARRHFREKQGCAGPFGKILGYVYRPTFDEGWNLTHDGEVLDRAAGRIIVGRCELRIKGRTIPNTLFKRRTPRGFKLRS